MDGSKEVGKLFVRGCSVFSPPGEDLDQPAEALDAGDALQIYEDLLDLHQPFSQAGHRKDRQLITRIDGQNRQEPPAAGWSVRGRLGDQKHFKKTGLDKRASVTNIMDVLVS